MSVSSITNLSALNDLLSTYNANQMTSNTTTSSTDSLSSLLGSDTSTISSFAALLSQATNTTATVSMASTSDLLTQRTALMNQKSEATSDADVETIQTQLDAINEQLAQALESSLTSSTTNNYNYSSGTDSFWSLSGDENDNDDGLSSMMMQSMNVSMLNSLNQAQTKLSERAASLQKIVAADSTNTAAATELQKVQNNLSTVSNQYNSLLTSSTGSSTSTSNLLSSLRGTNTTSSTSNGATNTSSLLSALSTVAALKQYEMTQNA